jgi:hypothetical protein
MDFIRDEIEEDILNRTESVETERDYEEREYDREYEERRDERYIDEEECLRKERELERLRRDEWNERFYEWQSSAGGALVLEQSISGMKCMALLTRVSALDLSTVIKNNCFENELLFVVREKSYPKEPSKNGE